MKRLIFILLLITNFTMAQVMHVFEFNEPQLKENGAFQSIEFENTFNTGVAGLPAIPYQSVSLLLPQGFTAVDVEIVKHNKVRLQGNFILLPAQSSRPLSEKGKAEFQMNQEVYKSDQTFPADASSQLLTATLHGHNIALTSFSPVEYIPASGELFYYQSITVIINTTEKELNPQELKMIRTDEYAIESIKRLVQNFDQIPAYTSQNKSGNDPYELLIITTEAFSPNFEPLQQMYLNKGIRSHIITKESINSGYSGQDLQEKIRNCITEAYANHQIENVLLGGDVELIPYRGFYCYVQSGSGYSDEGIPADLYYAALDGNWNTDGDNRWGEPGEDDLLPEIGIGRMPFSNAAELTNLINKSMMYQTQPVLGDFEKPLMVGEHLYSAPETWGSDYLELLIGSRNDNGYTTHGIPSDYTFQKLYESEGNWSKQQLINAINQGKQYVHHVGHASQTYVAKMTNSDITASNFSQTNGINKNFAIFHTHGCDCGSFDYNDCILERMVNIENFAAAVIGNSRYGWFNEGQTEGPAAHLHREMTDAQFSDRIAELGSALAEAKRMTAPWVTAPGQWEEGALRWNFYDLNLLGDPAMSVWTAEPYTVVVNHPTEIFVGAPAFQLTVAVNGLPAPGYRVSISKDNEIIASGFTMTNGLAILQFENPVTEVGTAQLIVSGYNIMPQISDLMFIPADGPYVVFESYTVNDAAPNGNGNGQADYFETVLLDMELKNVGIETAANITATLSTENDYVSINVAETVISSLEAGQVIAIPQAFSVTLAENIPDQEMVTFQLSCSTNDQNWNSSFYLIANAAVLQIGDYVINDLLGGNGNGLLDPGETVQLIVEATNSGHSASAPAIADLSANASPYITIPNHNQQADVFEAGQSKQISFELLVSNATPAGTVAELSMHLMDGFSEDWQLMYLPIGLQIEDFESGDFDAYEWHHAGNANWMVSPLEAYEGNFSAKSGMISNNQQSDLRVSLISMSNDNLSFARKVSSESNYDFLQFYLNDQKLMEWSGEMDWEMVSFPVPEGENTLRWSYTKDGSVSSGSDAAWIDYITFPGSTTMIDLGENNVLNNVNVWPNPSNGQLYISGLKNLNTSIAVIDGSGRKIFDFYGMPMENIKLNMLHNGVYILEIHQNNQYFRKKLVISK